MRCYKVQAKDEDGEVFGTRYAGTNALAREMRETLMAQFDVKKKDVSIEDADIPTGKEPLLGFINELAAGSDLVANDEDEDEDK